MVVFKGMEEVMFIDLRTAAAIVLFGRMDGRDPGIEGAGVGRGTFVCAYVCFNT